LGFVSVFHADDFAIPERAVELDRRASGCMRDEPAFDGVTVEGAGRIGRWCDERAAVAVPEPSTRVAQRLVTQMRANSGCLTSLGANALMVTQRQCADADGCQ